MIEEVEVVTHFCSDDLECDGDYCQVDLIINDKIIRSWDDYYHDKGAEKCVSLIEGVEFVQCSSILVHNIDIADYTC